MIARPFNLHKWIDENKALLQPPVGNKQIYVDNEDFIVMVVGGPNGRKDYHYEEGEELFYQIKGDIEVKIINEEGNMERIPIREGEMFLLPPRIPHSPQRPADKVGLVIERHRNQGEVDNLLWFCDNCSAPISQSGLELKDIGTQITSAIQDYNANEEAHVCGKCGHVN